MKALKCEMCGSNDVVKQEDLFVCQNCGTKYSVEAAKKMMIEGTVSVKGTVTVDNSGLIDNYLMMAKNAYDSGNQKEAESYCNKVIEINPNHSEAWFIKGKSAGWQSTLANIRLDESISCFSKAIDKASEGEIDVIKAEVLEEIDKLTRAILTLACNHFTDFPSDDTREQAISTLSFIIGSAFPLMDSCGGNSDSHLEELYDIVNEGAVGAFNNKLWTDYTSDPHPSEYDWREFMNGTDNCIVMLGTVAGMENAQKDNRIRYYKSLITMEQAVINSCSWTIGDGGIYVRDYSLTEEAKNIRADQIMEWHEEIKKLDPNYVIPERPSTKLASSGGCYVATAVYGSYNCPEVWTLRRFRDNTLDETWYGRAFIKTYYAISPTLVKWFGETDWFKKLWRKPLDKLVASLRNKGVENTSYIDKYLFCLACRAVTSWQPQHHFVAAAAVVRQPYRPSWYGKPHNPRPSGRGFFVLWFLRFFRTDLRLNRKFVPIAISKENRSNLSIIFLLLLIQKNETLCKYHWINSSKSWTKKSSSAA